VYPEYQIPAGMTHEEFPAMGTTVRLLLPERQAGAGIRLVRELFSSWEEQLSRFLPDSELARLNQRAGQPLAVGPLLYTVLLQSLAAAQATGGWYDPTLHGQLVSLGYDRTFADLRLPTGVCSEGPKQESPVGAGGGWRRIRFDRSTRTVTLPAGVGLDFGGIAKGMAVDAAIAALGQYSIDSALVNAGGDLAVHGCPPDGEAWPIAMETGENPAVVPLRQGGLATSGISRRRWVQGEHLRHHLLDPRTGLPSESGLQSVTVAAERCEQAEVAAKVAFLLGPVRGPAFLHSRGLSGLVIGKDGRQVAVGRWPLHRPEVRRFDQPAAGSTPS
jgi:thiamine biosynthesis lipoprotein